VKYELRQIPSVPYCCELLYQQTIKLIILLTSAQLSKNVIALHIFGENIRKSNIFYFILLMRV
jgi:hypothetical protein